MSNHHKNRHKKKNRNKKQAGPNMDLYDSLDERHTEIATEISPEVDRGMRLDRKETFRNEPEVESSSWLGWLAIGFLALSLFWLPLVFATASIALGIVARNRDLNVLGMTAVFGGIIVIALRFLVLPML